MIEFTDDEIHSMLNEIAEDFSVDKNFSEFRNAINEDLQGAYRFVDDYLRNG